MAVASYPTNPPSSNRPTREYRAAAAFLIAATFMLVILLLVVGSIPAGPPARWAVTLVGPIVLMIIMFATAVGLAQRATWAAATMTPLLYLLVVSGAISFVLAFTRSAFEIPLGLILAIWALRARPSGTDVPIGAAARLAIAAALAAALWALPVELLLRPGGVLIADDTALQPALEVTCESPASDEPFAVHVRYDWDWLRTEPWAGGEDVVQLQVFPNGPNGLIGLSVDETDLMPAGVRQSDIAIFPPIGMTFGVDLATSGFGPRSVGFSLIGPNGALLESGSVDVTARYVHGPASTAGTFTPALWQVETSARCEW